MDNNQLGQASIRFVFAPFFTEVGAIRMLLCFCMLRAKGFAHSCILRSTEVFTVSNNSLGGNFVISDTFTDIGEFSTIQHQMTDCSHGELLIFGRTTEEFDISNNLVIGTIPSEIGSLEELGMCLHIDAHTYLLSVFPIHHSSHCYAIHF